jgi:hypothetical protein
VKQNTKEPQVYSSGRYSAAEAFTPAQYDQLRQFLADTLQRWQGRRGRRACFSARDRDLI